MQTNQNNLIVEWINNNKEDIRTTIIALIIINLVVIGCSAFGGLLFLFLHIPNLIVANVCLAVPLVYLVKFLKQMN